MTRTDQSVALPPSSGHNSLLQIRGQLFLGLFFVLRFVCEPLPKTSASKKIFFKYIDFQIMQTCSQHENLHHVSVTLWETQNNSIPASKSRRKNKDNSLMP